MQATQARKCAGGGQPGTCLAALVVLLIVLLLLILLVLLLLLRGAAAGRRAGWLAPGRTRYHHHIATRAGAGGFRGGVLAGGGGAQLQPAPAGERTSTSESSASTTSSAAGAGRHVQPGLGDAAPARLPPQLSAAAAPACGPVWMPGAAPRPPPAGLGPRRGCRAVWARSDRLPRPIKGSPRPSTAAPPRPRPPGAPPEVLTLFVELVDRREVGEDGQHIENSRAVLLRVRQWVSLELEAV